MLEDAIERVLISEEDIQKRVAELGQVLTQDYADKNPIFVGILKGVVVFFSDMIRAVRIPSQIDFMSVSSYKGTTSTGKVNVRMDLSADIEGRHVVILEDILDSGLTLQNTVAYLKTKNPASVKICAFLDKPEGRKCDIKADYVGYTVPNLFVVGYGLDYNEKFRNLPYVGVLKPEVYSKEE